MSGTRFVGGVLLEAAFVGQAIHQLARRPVAELDLAQLQAIVGTELANPGRVEAFEQR